MTAHTHTERVTGCFRCELGRDEDVANEVEEAARPLARRLAEEAPALRSMSIGHGYRIVRD